jgi:outer membrane protease
MFMNISFVFGDYAFSIGTGAGILAGNAEEIVYRNAGNDSMLSQLLWNMEPLFYMSSSINFSPVQPLQAIGFFGDLSFKFGFSGRTGVMEDRDWQDTRYPGNLTNFSSHNNYTRDAMVLDLAAGLSVPLFSRILLKFYLGMSYMAFSWDARDGYTQYAKTVGGVYDTITNPWDESLPKTNYYGPAISYSQNWMIFSPGLSVSTTLFQYFSVELGCGIGTVIYCESLDDHYSRKLQFNDSMSGGLFLEPRLSVSFFSFPLFPHSQITLSVYAAYRLMSGSRGTTYHRSTGSGVNGQLYSAPDSGGAGFSAFDSGLLFSVRL